MEMWKELTDVVAVPREGQCWEDISFRGQSCCRIDGTMPLGMKDSGVAKGKNLVEAEG